MHDQTNPISKPVADHGAPPHEEPLPCDEPPPQEELERAIQDLRHGIDVEESFQKIYDHLYPNTYRFFERKVRRQDALDLTQEAFIRLYRKRQNIRAETTNGFFLFFWTIARNLRTRWRKVSAMSEQRHVEIPEPNGEEARRVLEAIFEDDPAYRPDQLYRDEELYRHLTEAIDQLPPRERGCAKLRFLEGYKNPEIAEVLHIQPNNVGVQIFQARQKLRCHLRDKGWDDLGTV